MLDASNATLYYGANMSEVCFNVRIINDLLIESLESFVIEVSTSNPYDRIIGNNMTEISIEDNDCTLVSLLKLCCRYSLTIDLL